MPDNAEVVRESKSYQAYGYRRMMLVTSCFVAFIAGMGISMGDGQMHPGVTPGHAGSLAGVFLTSIGLGPAVFPALVGAMTDAAGLQGGALTLTFLIAISAVVIAVFVAEPVLARPPEVQPRPA